MDKYVYESQDEKPLDEKVIVKTFSLAQEEKFTIKQLEDKIVRIEEQKDNLDLEIVKTQAKIDEATAALSIK